MTNMKCSERPCRRTTPFQMSSRNELVTRATYSRVNGWSLPPHPLQAVGFLTYAFLAIMCFGVYVPLLPPPWHHISYGVIGTIFGLNLMTHLAATSIDPADDSVRLKSYSRPMPIFDRTKQPHVIHQKHCYLCDVDVGSKVKHCGSCNKCISYFDHHCKWLNNCIGGRNYWLFILTILTCVLGTLLVIVVILVFIVVYFVDPATLRTADAFGDVKRNETWLVFLPLAPVQTSNTILLLLAFITIILTGITFLFLSHLLVFHIYLFFKGMSTYEFILWKRELQKPKDQEEGSSSSDVGQNFESLETPVDCQAPSHCSASTLTYQDRTQKAQMSDRLSEPTFSGFHHFPQLTFGERRSSYGTKESLQRIPGEPGVVMTPFSWDLNPGRGASPQFWKQSRPTSLSPSQAEGVPVVWSPLSVMDSAVVDHQVLH